MSDLNTLISEHWNAKAALDAAKIREKEARDALSDFLCKDEEGLKNKTLNLSGGYKLKHEVARSLKLDKSHESFRDLPRLLTVEQLNQFITRREEVKFNYSAYKSFDDETVAKLAPFCTVVDTVTIKYETKTDNR